MLTQVTRGTDLPCRRHGSATACSMKNLRPYWSSAIRPSWGVTLVELLIAVAIAGVLLSIVYPSYREYVLRARNTQAISDIQAVSAKIEIYYGSHRSYPGDLDEIGGAPEDPWGTPYEYLVIAEGLGPSITMKSAEKAAPADTGQQRVRKDKNLHPLNSDYDLYSMGADRRSVAPLTAKASDDDIIRARNGAFVGLAKDY